MFSLNSTQASPVPVTVTNYPQVYQYKPKDLWIAYGIAMLATAIAAVVGLHAVWIRGEGYSSRFSTIVRVAKNTGLDRLLDGQDDGSDPLPEHIARARLQVKGGKRLMTESD